MSVFLHIRILIHLKVSLVYKTPLKIIAGPELATSVGWETFNHESLSCVIGGSVIFGSFPARRQQNYKVSLYLNFIFKQSEQPYALTKSLRWKHVKSEQLMLYPIPKTGFIAVLANTVWNCTLDRGYLQRSLSTSNLARRKQKLEAT